MGIMRDLLDWMEEKRERKAKESGDNANDPGRAVTDKAISSKDRNRLGRMIHFLVAVALSFFIPYVFLMLLAPSFWQLAFIVAIAFHLHFRHKFWVYAAELTAVISQDNIGGRLVPYGPGWHLRYWWEEIHRNSNVPLQEITEIFSATFQTTTDAVFVEFGFGYRPDLKNILNFYRVKAASVNDQFQTFAKSTMTSISGEKSLDDLVKGTKQINKDLQDAFETDIDGKTKLETQYGIDVTFLKINFVRLSSEVAKARAAEAEAESLVRMQAKLLGYETPKAMYEAIQRKDVSMEDVARARRHALIQMGENVSESVYVGEGDAFGAIMGGLGLAKDTASEIARAKSSGGKQKNNRPKGGGKK